MSYEANLTCDCQVWTLARGLHIFIVSQFRRAFSERFDNDLHAMCDDLRRQDEESDRNFRTPAAANCSGIRHKQSVLVAKKPRTA